jgi:hypothetical protein
LEVAAELVRIIGVVVERFAGKLESCLCHADAWSSSKSHRWKVAELRRRTGYSHCVFKNKNGGWWCAHGRELFYTNITDANSDLLQSLLDGANENLRARIVLLMDSIRNGLIEHYREKMDFWDHVPYVLLGVFYLAVITRHTTAAKALLQKAFAEYDYAVDNGREARLHRVAVLLLSKAKLVRGHLAAFLARGVRLEDHPVAFWALLRYYLVPICERWIESIHAQVKRLGNNATYILPPSLCASLR